MRSNKNLEEKFKMEAELKGLTYICDVEGNGYKKYIINKCGHEKITRTDTVRNCKIVCDICFKEQLIKDAEKINLELIGECEDKKVEFINVKFVIQLDKFKLVI